MRYCLHIAILTFVAMTFAACYRTPDPRLLHAESLMELGEDSVKSALVILKDIPVDSLSGSDRHLLDLLTLKVADKTYMKHTSDSLAMEVVEYYRRHPEGTRYPEALYLAGRTYSDMGDYPTALDYYYQAIECLPDTKQNLHLRGCIVSDIGWSLDCMSLYSAAIPFIKEAIRIDSIENKVENQVASLLNLIFIFDHQNRIDSVSKVVDKVKRYYDLVPCAVQNLITIQEAKCKEKQDSLIEALQLIRGIPESNCLEPDETNLALAVASKIYLRAGIVDTAYLYAKQLAWSADELNRKAGFDLLFSEKMVNLIPHDSLQYYATTFRDVIDKYHDTYDSSQTTIQNSLYNYGVHDREKKKAEKKSIKLFFALLSSGIVILMLGGIIYVRYSREKRITSEYTLAKEHIKDLKKMLDIVQQNFYYISSHTHESSKNEKVDVSGNSHINIMAVNNEEISTENRQGETNSLDLTKIIDIPIEKKAIPTSDSKGNSDPKKSLKDMREHLRTKILNASNYGKIKIPVETELANSDVVEKLNLMIEKGKVIKVDSPLWDEIVNTINKISPEFIDIINELAGIKIPDDILGTALLIRLGLKPTQISALSGRAKSTFTYRRDTLAECLFDKKVRKKELDNVIRSI